jgi:hypothetical protein
MDDRPFWFHPDANAEVLSAHDRYAEVTLELAGHWHAEQSIGTATSSTTSFELA